MVKLVPDLPRRKLKAIFDEYSRQWIVTPPYTGKTYSGHVQWNHEAMAAVRKEELKVQVGLRARQSTEPSQK